MKKVFKIFAFLLIVIGSACSSTRMGSYSYGQQNRYEEPGYDSYQIFYDQLSPYGNWVDYPQYGYVWIPNEGRNFFPYVSDGRWVLTDYGWAWLSDFEWGWAPFHYGRWDYDNYYGWFWVPDDQWGPAWVIWRRANGYYGWAPMRPGVSARMGIYGGDRDIERWSFVRERDFGRGDVSRHYVNRRNNEEIFRNSTVINNSYIDNRRNATYISGPRPDDVRRVTGRRINAVTVVDSDRPGTRISNSELDIFRPPIRGNNDRRAVPPRVADPRSVRPAEERRASNMRRGNQNEVQGSRSQDARQIPSSRRRQAEDQGLSRPSRRRQAERQRQTDEQQRAKEQQAQPAQPSNAQPSESQQDQNSRRDRDDDENAGRRR
jgi:hypothetical protein